ncbi:cell division protein SepF [Candidatus Woesearchaeota archaeon]|jgi:SepF-like predicted cell division protein (DUF552 family)|nr:cell division protein SepF [Candidatus Woesearchaeota archaeon]MBT3537754.1 cell division protein SepF [Candidatus Woesearchaeota archaeon]MBT4697885.1 cell division protein SepF [Candidatus Woesearchaeota archaeon]MBT4717455.1 cell division protein SepF [Candidatus Woesearchaeota archaeon]MBT7105423.1 cell division protein SepF [Candidatus Woesearchaeota archaeon]
MKNFFNKVKSKIGGAPEDDYMIPQEEDEGYVEISPTSSASSAGSKVIVRPFMLTDFADTKPILDSLREGYTIALVNIKPLKDKDLVELKRSINKLKKTCDAIDGDIAGFGEDWITICPSFAQIHREAPEEVYQGSPQPTSRDTNNFETY